MQMRFSVPLSQDAKPTRRLVGRCMRLGRLYCTISRPVSKFARNWLASVGILGGGRILPVVGDSSRSRPQHCMCCAAQSFLAKSYRSPARPFDTGQRRQTRPGNRTIGAEKALMQPRLGPAISWLNYCKEQPSLVYVQGHV